MIISVITVEDLEAARDMASVTLGNELLFSEFESYGPKRHRVRLQVRHINGPGARRHSSMYMLGCAGKPRRSRFACAHAHGMLFVAIYERAPYARIETAFAYYRSAFEFLALNTNVLERNVGSRMFPLRFGDECTCLSDDIGDDTLRTPEWWIGAPELPSRENTEVVS